jgi:EAL domain-containing protein (putative c-di-GMP-specific phosphodiesterase class I)
MTLIVADSSSRHFQRMEETLREALLLNQFVLHYQPYRNLATQKIAGVEALIRWQHPEDGLIYPGHFIHYAERSHLIDSIGEWVLWQACVQMSRWQALGIDVPSISVNVSPRQLNNLSFATLVQTILNTTNLTPEKLDLEITESTEAIDEKSMCNTVASLRQVGVKISIDDFGTGFSSLARLRIMQVDRIKIDRSFVSDLILSTKDACLVQSMIHLAQQLEISVIAEGIEDAETLVRIQAMGCDEGQGYYFAKPLSSNECEKYLRTTQ